MDTLDKISTLIIILLVLSLGVLGLEYQGAADNSTGSTSRKYGNSISTNEVPPESIEKVKNLIAANNIEKAEALVGEMLEKYSYEGDVHMLKGDIMMRKQDPVASIDSYRAAVELDPDYVDKKAPSFQGRKIRIAVDEAKTIIDNALAKTPDNKEMKKCRKTVYYLLRSLAGSCG
jgi:predicted negative regulator of RcsB-dependent stress response